MLPLDIGMRTVRAIDMITDAKKITVFLPSLSGGGAERMMVNVANEFASQGVQVDLVIAQSGGDLKDIVEDNVNLIEFGHNRARLALWDWYSYLFEVRPDIVLSTLNYANIIAVLLNQLLGSKTQIYLREANSPLGEMQHRSGLLKHILYFFQKFTYPMSDGVIAVSEDVRKSLVLQLGLSPAKVRRIGNPVLTRSFWSKAGESADHLWLKNKVGPVFVSVGRLSAQKNFGSLIRAFAVVLQKQDARLIIVGEGEDRSSLEGLIAELEIENSVDLIGFVANPLPIVAASDVFVSSSLWEGLPNSLIEALAVGTKIVATSCPGGSAEILDDGRFGHLVDPMDDEALAGAMSTAINDSQSGEVAGWCQQWDAGDVAAKYAGFFGLSLDNRRTQS